MLVKGDKIKQVKEINGFNKVGDEFLIKDIDVGVITFESTYGRGVMSYDEFERYFEKVVEEKWTDWTITNKGYKYRTKGMLTELEFYYDGIHTFAKCLECDKESYSIDTAIEICKSKHEIILLQRKIKEY